MLRTKSILLSESVTISGHPVSEILLREPPFDSIIVHGEPYTVGRTPEGGVVAVPNSDAISAYVDICLVNVPRDALQEIGTAKTREVVETIMGFFQPDASPEAMDSPDGGSTTSPENLSLSAG